MNLHQNPLEIDWSTTTIFWWIHQLDMVGYDPSIGSHFETKVIAKKKCNSRLK